MIQSFATSSLWGFKGSKRTIVLIGSVHSPNHPSRSRVTPSRERESAQLRSMLFRLSERRQKTISDILFFDSKSSAPVISDLSFWGQLQFMQPATSPRSSVQLRSLRRHSASSICSGVSLWMTDHRITWVFHESCLLLGMSGFPIRFKGQCVLFSFVVTPLTCYSYYLDTRVKFRTLHWIKYKNSNIYFKNSRDTPFKQNILWKGVC